jgi:hypothetical protein
MPDTDAQKVQITNALKERYFSIFPPLQQSWTPEQHEKNRLSRSLAAFAIEKLADVAPSQAANALVDGGNDNGIDAIHFDRTQNRLWLVQSKAGGGPDRGENKKFCDGIRDLVNGRFDRFNAAVARLRPDVEDALSTDGLEIVGCNVHLGDGLGPHAISDLQQLKTELNQFVQRFDWRDLNLSVVHSWLTAEQAVAPVNVTLTLERWYGVDQPWRAFYGLVTAVELAGLYQQHGKALFEKNIRHYLGAQTVNSAIAATVQDRPAELFYLSNGLTAVCTSIRPAPGANNQQGTFTIEGFSIVNGAQTVGSIATTHSTNGPVSPVAKLLITLIEVGTSADNLGPQITRARNTQNAVRGLHFAALDPQQERLRRALAVSSVTYHYRPSAEAIQGGPNVITLEQAAIALASFSGETRTVVAAKNEVGQLYAQTGDFYPTLFRDSLSGIQLCRSVRIFEYLDGIFEASERSEVNFSRRKMFYRHGRFFVLHILARRHRHLIEKPEEVLSEADKAELSRVALELAELIYEVAEAHFSQTKGYLSIFRNMTDSEPLASAVMQRLAQQEAQRHAAAAPEGISPTSQGQQLPGTP